MSDWNMLIWLTQLGLSVVLPLAGMTGLAIWLCSQYQLGRWVILLGILLGFILAVCSFKNTLKEMEYMEKRRKESHSQKENCFTRNGNYRNRRVRRRSGHDYHLCTTGAI